MRAGWAIRLTDPRGGHFPEGPVTVSVLNASVGYTIAEDFGLSEPNRYWRPTLRGASKKVRAIVGQKVVETNLRSAEVLVP